MIRPQRPIHLRTAASGRTAAAGILGVKELASTWSVRSMERAPDAPPPHYLQRQVSEHLRRRQRLEEDGLAGRVDLVQAVGLQRRVAVLVEPIGAKHRIAVRDRKSTRLNSSHMSISYA